MTVYELYKTLKEMGASLAGDYELLPCNVYREGVPKNRRLIAQLADQFLLPGSRIRNSQAMAFLRERSLAGESCLLLLEHYSNFDYPSLFRLVEKDPLLGHAAAESLLPIQGMKLSETHPVTAFITNSYDTIVIYPSRSIDQVKDFEELERVKKISVPINHAAMRELIVRKNKGRIITVFPAGTRYRPLEPDSKKGVREIHSYLKAFDHVCFVGVNGIVLDNSPDGDMTKDKAAPDLIILTFSDPVRGRDFRNQAIKTTPPGQDAKQHIVDEVMRTLEELHEECEPLRQKEKALLAEKKTKAVSSPK